MLGIFAHIWWFFESPNAAAWSYLFFYGALYHATYYTQQRARDNVNWASLSEACDLNPLEVHSLHKYYFFAHYPRVAKNLSSVASLMNIIAALGAPYLIYKAMYLQGALLAITIFTTWRIARMLNPLFFLAKDSFNEQEAAQANEERIFLQSGLLKTHGRRAASAPQTQSEG